MESELPMKTPILLLSAVVLTAAPHPTVAQSVPPDTIRVGDARIDASFIEGFSVTWRRTAWDSTGRDRAPNLVEETVEVVRPDDGVELLKFVQTWRDSVGEISFVTARVAERRSMAYRAFHTGRTPGGLGRLDFEGARVFGFYVPSPEQPIQSFALVLNETPLASFGGLLVAAIRQEEGLHAIIPGFGWGGSTNPNLSWQSIRVVGRERVELTGTAGVDAWRVEGVRSPGSVTTYWVTKRPPYFVQAEARSANGSGSRFVIVDWARARLSTRPRSINWKSSWI